MKNTSFKSVCIFPDTWKISGDGCDCYLLIGEKEALMIDAGCSTNNIQAYAQTPTERPLNKVLNTHAHFDHTGGNGYFKEILCTEGISRSAKNYMDCDGSAYPLDYDFTLIQDGQIIDLGNRHLQIIVLDCHSPENLAVIDLDRRLLFPGDELEADQVLLLPGYAEKTGQLHASAGASVEQYLDAMKKLAEHSDFFDFICPAHNGSPVAPCYLTWYIELAEQIIAGTIVGDADCTSPSYQRTVAHYSFPSADYRRAQWKGASLVYCNHRIKKSNDAPDTLPATPLHLISAYCI